MSDRSLPAGPMRIYLAGPVNGGLEQFLSVAYELRVMGHAVSAPAFFRRTSADTDDLLNDIDDDMAALDAADVLLTLPGSASLWEVALAPMLGVRTETVGEFLARAFLFGRKPLPLVPRLAAAA